MPADNKDVENPGEVQGDAAPKKNRRETYIGLPVCIIILLGLAIGAGIGGSQNDEEVAAPAPEDSAGEAMTLSIFHMNDHHSQVQGDGSSVAVTDLPQEGFPANLTGVEEVEYSFGGYPRITSLIKAKSTEAEEAGKEVIKIHAGDALVGSVFYSLFAGDSDADMMNKICFDAFTVGNHEFDDGDATLADFIRKLQSSEDCAATPVLGANVVPHSASPLKQLQDEGAFVGNVIKTLSNGERIGIIGIDIRNKTMESSQPDEGTVLLDEVETATEQVAELQEAGVNKIVIVSHIGYFKDLELMATIEGVDVVVGGDSHTLLSNTDAVGFVGGEYPTTVETASGSKVCVVQAWEYSKGLGMLDVEFDAEGNVVSCNGDFLIPFDPVDFDPALDAEAAAFISDYLSTTYPNLIPLEEDVSTNEVLSAYREESDRLVTTVIATVPDNICFERIPGQGRSQVCPPEASAIQGGGACNVVARAFLEETRTADVAIQNGGGCRTDIVAGDFTIESGYNLLPFANTLVTLVLTGAEIVKVLGEAATNAFGSPGSDGFPFGGSTGAYPYASGLRFNVNASAAADSVITDVEINSRVAGEWAPIVLDETYTIVTNSFIAAGRDGYLTFGEIDSGLIVDTYQEYAQSFIDYAKKVTVINDLPLEEYSTKAFTIGN
eukprot:scaffold1212_cov96-Cylindrotheca_fusiformis.AAC.1